MKLKRILLPVAVITLALAACAILVVGLASTGATKALAAALPVTFPDGDWPWYAQEEITLRPEPPIMGAPVEICAEVVNPNAEMVPVTLKFGVIEFSLTDAFMPIEPVDGILVEVPPGLGAIGCVGWVPPDPGPWAVQVILEQEAFSPLVSQRVVDLYEPLAPNVAHELDFVVGPFGQPGQYTLSAEALLLGWSAALSTDNIEFREVGETQTVTLITTPPRSVALGSRRPVVKVEMFPGTEPIGPVAGFVKYDNPPVILHHTKDPFFAESEISVWPYPPRAGEPTQLCVELYNVSDAAQTVVVHFSRADFGIGLPWSLVNEPIEVTLPPHSRETVCTVWVPEDGGHFCVQVRLDILGKVAYLPQFSQRNLDVAEPLVAGQEHIIQFQVGNYPQFTNPDPVTTDIWLETEVFLEGWQVILEPDILPAVAKNTSKKVSMTVIPPPGVPMPPDGTPIADIRAFIDSPTGPKVIGGIRKVYRPPVVLHRYPDPVYAEREITVEPYPPRAGEPTEICVELYNPTPLPMDVNVQFSWANFGIGLPFTPINGLRPVHLPPYSVVRECIYWIPPVDGHVCLQVELFGENYPPQRSQRNIDVNEPLKPLTEDTLVFNVQNPREDTVDIYLAIHPRLDGWKFELEPAVLPSMGKGETRPVSLTVLPPEDLPEDGTPIVDIEAYANGQLIGGFRKIFRPPVPIHRPGDPIYAESEIFIHPYPTRAREPTELGVEINNPTTEPQEVLVQFSYANFGIGLPFTPIDGPIPVTVPPEGFIVVPIMWIPPDGGHWCIQVEIIYPETDKVFLSQRNIDVGEPLEPLTAHSLTFPVGNPYEQPMTITLGLIPHLPGWGLELSQDVLRDMKPAEFREVTLTVTPPADLPEDGAAIVDVEAYTEGKLIGGFRKIFRPPVPVHRPKDPIYAESEIGIDPYPAIAGAETVLSVEVFNPTPTDQVVEATFSIASFGIGLPFSTTGITPNPIKIFVPAYGAARGHTIWIPPRPGKFCVKVELQVGDHEVVWSQRNIDVGEPLEPGLSHKLVFPVSNPTKDKATVELGLIRHRDDIDASLSTTLLPDLEPGETVSVTLTVSPTEKAELGSGGPIVDVEAYIDGELIGGFRKLDVPPIFIHKPHEKVYAESDIYMDPEPPLQNKATTVGTVVQNNGDKPITVDLEFGWAKFGMGIPFTHAGMVPYSRTVTVDAGMTKTAEVTWTPTMSGPQCVIIKLKDREGLYEPQESQRNVVVEEQPPCGVVRHFSFTVQNSTPFSATVDLGTITFNVPADWIVTTIPSDTLTLGPGEEGIVEVIVEIPCPTTLQAFNDRLDLQRLQAESGSVPTIDVEGYIDGDLVGGIEIQLPAEYTPPWYMAYLPIVGKTYK